MLAVVVSCSPSDELGTVVQPTIYGTDDRTDVYAHADARLRELAQQSTVVLVSRGDVNAANPANVTLAGTTLAAQENLCAGQRFASDPAPGFCSGTLIDDDLVITAGHCITDPRACAGTRFVFNFYRDAADTLHTITSDDVYACASIVVRTQTFSPFRDYAILRLDRRVTAGHVPAPVHRGHDLLAAGAGVAVIGFPTGIPAKIDSGGTVRDPGAGGAAFVATTDTFHGNSGSAVYELASHEIRGLLIDGDVDWDSTPAGCQVAHTCAETGCSGETSTYVFHAMDALCAVAPTALPCGGLELDGGGVDAEAGAAADAGGDVDVTMDAPVDAGADRDVTDVVRGDTRAFTDTPIDLVRDAGRRTDASDGGDANTGRLVGLHGGCMCRISAAVAVGHSDRGERAPALAAVAAVAVVLARSRRRRR